ncbi:hypothetical protein RUM44_013722 [Polyplax serrata]|uniref:Uncharacterized protein n=1 Tax=Polyplax serrata TaxID=468196 RepID=A0ABR1BII7_POLSC
MLKIASLFVITVVILSCSAHEHHHKEEHAYPKYVFEYGVHDPHTHDAKKQWESRDGDVVKGSYRVIQPDGRIRIVNYYSDGKNGFNAEVKYIGKAEHPKVYKTQSGQSGVQGFSKGFAQGFAKKPIAHDQGKQWKGKAPVIPKSFHYVPVTHTFGYTIDHSSGRSKSSALGLGYNGHHFKY